MGADGKHAEAPKAKTPPTETGWRLVVSAALEKLGRQ